LWVGAVDLHAPDRPYRTYCATIWISLMAGAIEPQHRRVRTRRLGDRERARSTDTETGKVRLVHEGERLARPQGVENDDGPVRRAGISQRLALRVIRRNDKM